MSTLSVELDEVARDVLDALLRLLFEPFPRTCSQCRQTRRFASVATTILGDFIQRMYRNIYNVASLIDDANHLLIRIACRNSHQTSKLTNTKINMHDEVAWLHFLQFFKRERHLASSCFIRLEVILMEAFKYLVIGKTA